MAEGSVGTCPQVFVVDSHANYVSLPSEKKPRWARVGQNFLILMVGLTMLGLVVEGCIIYNLYKKTQEFSTCKSHALCQNLSNPKTPGQEDGTFGSQVGHKDLNEILQPHPGDDQQRPFAQLIGSGTPQGDNNVVQWFHERGESVMKRMSYDKGKLLVERDGYYYLYSKVTVNAEECLRIQHKVMKTTKAYGLPIELMKSNSFHCQTQKHPQAKNSGGGDLWNSFLAGIFHLQSGDEVFAELDHIQKIRPGPTENLMGAFMISP